MTTPLLVTAKLSTPLDGDAPRLDALLVYAMSLHQKFPDGYKVDRSLPAPSQDEVPIPLLKQAIGPWKVARCSNAIYSTCETEYVEHVNKRIGVEHAGLLAPSARLVVSTTNSWTKSYRVPQRMRRIDRVCWFAVAYRRALLKALRENIDFLGRKRSIGNGKIESWEITHAADDYSWFAPSNAGTVLMATLPHHAGLPPDLVGYRRDFGGVVPPYWHPDRYTEIVVPC
jgi:hypothetical protein